MNDIEKLQNLVKNIELRGWSELQGIAKQMSPSMNPADVADAVYKNISQFHSSPSILNNILNGAVYSATSSIFQNPKNNDGAVAIWLYARRMGEKFILSATSKNEVVLFEEFDNVQDLMVRMENTGIKGIGKTNLSMWVLFAIIEPENPSSETETPAVKAPTYTITVTEFGTETIRIEGKNLEFCINRAESIARSYGMQNQVMFRDGTVYHNGEDFNVKIISSNGLSMEDEWMSWTCTPEEIEVLKRDGAFAVIRKREQKARQEQWAKLPKFDLAKALSATVKK